MANALAEALNCSMAPSPSSAQINTSSVSSSSSNIPREAQHGGKSSPHHPSIQSDPLLDCLKNKHFSYFSKFYPPKFSVDFGPSIDGVVIRPNFKVSIFEKTKFIFPGKS